MCKITWQLLLIVCGFGSVFGTDTTLAVVSREGRNIQRDGFLLEWDNKESQTLAAKMAVQWNAMNTPEGFAGFVRYTYSPDSCGRWRFTFKKPQSDSSIMKMDISLPGPQKGLYNVALDTEQGDSLISAEWLIPWSEINPDSTGSYRLTISAENACEETAVLEIRGKTKPRQKEDAPETVPASRLIFQGLIIAVLLIAYILVRSRAKKIQNQHK